MLQNIIDTADTLACVCRCSIVNTRFDLILSFLAILREEKAEKEKKAKMRKIKRYAMIGVATVGGGALLGNVLFLLIYHQIFFRSKLFSTHILSGKI